MMNENGIRFDTLKLSLFKALEIVFIRIRISLIPFYFPPIYYIVCGWMCACDLNENISGVERIISHGIDLLDE